MSLLIANLPSKLGDTDGSLPEPISEAWKKDPVNDPQAEVSIFCWELSWFCASPDTLLTPEVVYDLESFDDGWLMTELSPSKIVPANQFYGLIRFSSNKRKEIT